MSIALFLVVNSDDIEVGTLAEDFIESELTTLARLPGIERIDRYDLAEFDDPMTNDGKGPIVTLQVCFSDTDSLNAGLRSSELKSIADKLAGLPGASLSHDAMDMLFFPVAGEDEPGEWTAPLSYVVRYHHPSEEPKAFVEFYITHHPQVEANFPNIRSIMCYVPIEFEAHADIHHENYMLGNEVVFDSTEALHAALTSPVLKDMKADSANFPDYGHNTHFAMHRRRVV